MIGRFLAFLLGATLGVLAIFKVRSLLQRATPEAVSERVGERVDQARSSLGERVEEFTETFTRSSRQREEELRVALGMTEDDTGRTVADVEDEIEDAALRARRAAGR